MKIYNKSIRRSIRKSLGRFLAIIAIVALGVGFLTGLLASTPDMKKTVDAYYDEYNAADINIKSAVPLLQEDVDSLRDLDGVLDIMSSLTVDMNIDLKESTMAARVYSYDFSEPNKTSNINRLQLLEGSFPLSENECVVERGGTYLIGMNVGDTLVIGGKDKTVTGIVGNTWYFSQEREPTNVGNGRLSAVVYCHSVPTVITDVYVTVTGARSLNAFNGKYDDAVAKVTERIKEALPDAFVLDRHSNIGFAAFIMSADKVAAIAVVFPVFFFLVAALVSLTTMTRMVEEERIQIGSLRAMGYSKGHILTKYMIYCGLAGIIGCVVGVLAGFQLLPAIIWNAYKFMFHLPALTVHFNVMFAGVSSSVALVTIMVATLYACLKTLKEKPAELLLPRAPKPGKRILLERIPFLWNGLKFKYKSTLRNLFRYKKHFFMTVIGIAGCTALVLTGFGLKNSVDGITQRQYDDIFKYNLTISLTEPITNDLSAFLADDSVVDDWTLFYTEAGQILNSSDKESLQVFSPEKDERISAFIKLNKRGSKTETPFLSSSVILTEKIARKFKLQVGDTFLYEGISGKKQELRLTGITENYVGSYLYVGSDFVQKESNTVVAVVKTAVSDIDEQAQKLLAVPGVGGAEFTENMRATYNTLAKSIRFIVVVLIIAAGGLAVIVLYNLINININERSKELATLKVLGYRNGEVAGYVYREIIILTIVGVLVGLLLGLFLHLFVIMTAETVELMFVRKIAPLSFVYSAIITIGFSLLVDFVMYFKIKKIDMIDSMKASE